MAFVKAGLWGPQAIIDSTGHPQPGATAAVYLTDGVTLASLWTSAAKSVVMANPTQADIHGNLHFWTDPGPYMLKMLIGTVVTWLDVEVPIDPGEAAQDADVTAAIATAEAYADGIVAAALAAALAGSQPLDADLTAIAALSTTAYGRAFLALADAAAGRTALGLGTAATHAVGDFDAAGTAAAAAAALVNSAPGTLDTLNELATALADDPAFATTMTNALAGKQPLDSDLTAIAALSTTAFGRSALALADSAALRVLAGTVIGTDVQAHDSDLDAIAALSTTTFGRALLVLADAAALRTAAGLGTAATAATTDFDAAGTASAAVTALINGAPGALDTLNELATALGDDAAFATTVTNALATKLIAGATSGTANQAALPAAVAHTHEVVKTDDGGVYVSTGSSWVQLVPPAGTYAPASGIPESAVTGLVADLAAKAVILTPTAVKTANYTAVAGDLVLCDTSGGIFTVTLPTAPVDKTSIAVDLIVSGNTLTVARGGADVFQKAGGATTLTMNTANRVLVLQYQTSTAVWHVRDHLPAVITTKGDLLTYSTERVRLGVGTDGQVLTADSTQTAGIKWAASGLLNALDATVYGVLADGNEVTDAVTTAASATLTSASAAFTSADTGKAFQLTIPARSVLDCVTNATTTITSATAAFTAGDVGKTVTLNNYSATTKAYGVSAGGNLTTTIAAYVSATQVTLTAAPGWSTSTTYLNIGQTSVVGTLTFVNATTVTLSGTAAFTSTGSTLRYGTDNYAALQTAATAASAAKKQLVLPPGRMCIKPGTAGTRSIKISGDLNVTGARGVGSTKIAWIGIPATTVIQAVWEFTVASNVNVTDMQLDGPLDGGFVFPAMGTFSAATAGIYINGPDSATAPVQTFERVKVTGWFGNAFAAISAGSNGDTYFRNCDFTALWVTAQMYSAAGYTKRFWWFDCYLHDTPFQTNLSGNLTGEFFYLHQNVSVHAERCRFKNQNYYAIQWQGGDNTAPEFARFQACKFENDVGNCIYMMNLGNASTIVEKCSFNQFGAGVMVRQSARIANNFFNLGGVASGATGIVYTAVSAGDAVTIEGNQFNLVESGGLFGKGMSIGGAVAAQWTVVGNTFRVTGAGTGGCVGVECVIGGDIGIASNNFYGLTNGLHQTAIAIFAGTSINADISNNRIAGLWATSSGEAAIVVTGNAPGKCRIRGNTFDMATAGRPYVIGGSSGAEYSHTFQIEDNYYAGYSQTPTSRGTNVQNGRLRPGIGIVTRTDGNTSGGATFTSASAGFTAEDVGKLIIITGAGVAGAVLATTISAFGSATSVTLTTAASTSIAGTATWTIDRLVAATTITPDLNADTWHVTGTTTIATITLANDILSMQAFHGSRIYLIADNTWATSAGGNILPNTVAARVVGQTVCLTYDGTANKWYEIV